ncbi:hypothetical protein WH50_00985 [Pokkaliibacter plantistimulans]|uniref:Glycosyl transferase family 1 n=1 Tax=Pokkaliibacter plantistimulans TaxID=1635171 RepID=A0ABX5M2L9_9GAMM|nr:glycosyltransferase family 4 protein [Pokkaliibacter plantistimulans]PXF33144.1 hypothetical protein WH50_00985 [Pokkaliibacter plantistimulans]
MPKRKLHIVHTESSCGWGGQELRILSESQGLMSRGHRITLVCPSEADIYNAAVERGINVVSLPVARKKVSALMALRRWLAANHQDIDVLNTHSSTDSWLTALACLSLRDSPPIVRTRHVSSPISKKASSHWLYQRAAQHLVVTGEPLRQHLAEHNGFALSSMTSVPTGIDLNRFGPGDRESLRRHGHLHGRIIGILATLRNWKGHAYLFEAFAQLKGEYSDLSLLVVGDGPQRHNLERLARELGIEEKVLFVGNQHNPEDWLNMMDIFVLPSYGDEGVSQAVMQAMATRLPVITTAVGGMRDAVQHEETGLLVDIRSSVAIEQALRCYLDNPAFAKRMAEAAFERSQRYFGLETMLDRMEAIFDRFSRGHR